MKTSLSSDSFDAILNKLSSAMSSHTARSAGESARRQPVHTVYGGAHLFKADTAARLGKLAVRSLETYASTPEIFAEALGLSHGLAAAVHARVGEKLAREAVEDLRIDFEDGYGYRPDDEEDAHSISTASEVAAAMASDTLPPFVGIRVKAFSDETIRRAIRTLDLFLTHLAGLTKGRLPDNFVITLPKVVAPDQIAALVDILDEIEPKLGFAAGSLKIEMMIETTRSIVAPDGRIAMPLLLDAARGRCTGAHFGAYDYTASCSITAAFQDMLHEVCDFARSMMKVSLSGTGVWLSDSATNIMPIAPHRGDDLNAAQLAENTETVHRAWRLHYRHCRHSLANGFYQGWDLHPAQLPSRYAAVFSFFLEGLEQASERLRNFVGKAAQATLVGDVFDDAATGQGLLNYFLRAISCGALTEQEVLDRTGITLEELRAASFDLIVKNRRGRRSPGPEDQ